ncbi:hypothetical protein [uncultured Clostridium sp.]|uniref:hypothetical protein n=1 Tax=uncultured Clostridium sp. TaxID=59620 RepID=UPI00263881AA|nr:hypothetical protein [uncultured Clostridium sp.]
MKLDIKDYKLVRDVAILSCYKCDLHSYEGCLVVCDTNFDCIEGYFKKVDKEKE